VLSSVHPIPTSSGPPERNGSINAMTNRHEPSSFSSSASSWLSSFLDQADLPVIHLPREESSASESTNTSGDDESSVSKPLMKRGTSDSSGVIISGESSSGFGSSTGLASRASSYRSNEMGSRTSSYVSTGLVSRSSSYYAPKEKGDLDHSSASSSSSAEDESESESGSSDASSSTDNLKHQSMDDPSARTDPPDPPELQTVDDTETPSTPTPSVSVETEKTTNTTNTAAMHTGQVDASVAAKVPAFDESTRKNSENSDSYGFANFVSLIKTGDLAAAFDSWNNIAPGSNSDESDKSNTSGNGETTNNPPRSLLSSSFRDVWKFQYSPSQTQIKEPTLPISAPTTDSALGVPTTPTKKTSSKSMWRVSSTLLATIQEEASLAGDEYTVAPTTIRPTDRRYHVLGAPPSRNSRSKSRRRCLSFFLISGIIGALVVIIVLLLVPAIRELTRSTTTTMISPDGTVTIQPSRPPSMLPTRQKPSRSPVSIGGDPVPATSAPTIGIPSPEALASGKIPSSTTSSPSNGSPSDSAEPPSLFQPFLFPPITMPSPTPSSDKANPTSAPVPRAGDKDVTFMPSSQSSTLTPSVLIAIEPSTMQDGPSSTPTSTPFEAPTVRPSVLPTIVMSDTTIPTAPPGSSIMPALPPTLQPTNLFIAPISASPQQTAGPSFVSPPVPSLRLSPGPSQDPDIVDSSVSLSPSTSPSNVPEPTQTPTRDFILNWPSNDDDINQFTPSASISDVEATNGWLLLGNEIMGIAIVNSRSSTSSVCLSANGDIAAVADEFGVRVLGVRAGSWIQIGQTLPGAISAMSLSGDGQTLACGYLLGDNSSRVEIFRFTGQQWIKTGQELAGNCVFMNSISLSENGAVVAIGSPLENNAAGFITVHRYDFFQGIWFQVGESILGDFSNDYAGVVRLNDDGTRLLVGYPGHSTPTQLNAGLARVFKVEQNSWRQVGQDLVGNARLKQLGHAVAISSSGDYIAVSAPFSNPLGFLIGQVFVYSLSPSGMWEQMGPTIQDAIAVYSDEAGRSLAISSNGMTVCLGAPRAQSVRVLTFSAEDNTWEEIGFLRSERIAFGIAVALSSDGKTLATGSGHELGSKSTVSIFYRNATAETSFYGPGFFD
jgi:hypothetical protein